MDQTPPAPKPPVTQFLVGLVTVAALALAGLLALRYAQDHEPESAVSADEIRQAQVDCTEGRVREGLLRLDSLDTLDPGNADVLSLRGQCRSVRFAADSVQSDARAAFADLSAAIAAVQAAPEAFQVPLERLYHQRAFLVQALRPGDWAASIADFDRALDLNPEAPVVVLDRGVARALSGDTAAARADLRRYERLAPDGSTEARRLRDLLRPAAPRRDTTGA